MSWKELEKDLQLKERLKVPHTVSEVTHNFQETIDALLSRDHVIGHILARLAVRCKGSDGSRGGSSGSATVNWTQPMCNLSLDARMFVMEHEFMHIIDGHLELPPDLRARFGQTKVNYAADIVVNQQCTVSPCELENSLVTHKRYKFPENLDIYGYLDLLPEFKEDPNAPGNDLEMPSVSGPSPETVEQDVRQAAKEAVERGAAGDTTERFKKALEPKPGAFDLAMCFSNFVNIVAKSERTLRKRLTSRRYKIPPGSRSIPKSMPGIYFGCDVSGSMDDRDIETFYGALRIVHRKISGIVGQFDTEVFKDSEKILQEAVADDIINREGHGGTSFVPVFERANELGFAGCVLFTDTWGEFPDRYDGQALVVVPEHIMGDRCNVPAWAKIVPLRARE